MIVLGDFNGHIGLNGEQINNNGGDLLNFADTNNLYITNMEEEQNGKWTWERDNLRYTLDYVLLNDLATLTYKGLCIDSENDKDINSDHRMVGISIAWAKSKITYRGSRRKIWKNKNIDWERFEEAMNEEISKTNINEEISYKMMVNVINKVAYECIGKKIAGGMRKRGNNWWTEEIKNAIRARKEANREHRKLKKNRSEHNQSEINQKWEEYLELKNLVNKLIKTSKRRAENEELENKERQEKRIQRTMEILKKRF